MIFLFVGFGLEACFLLAVGYTHKNNAAAITCLTLAVGVSGFAISGKLIVTVTKLE